MTGGALPTSVRTSGQHIKTERDSTAEMQGAVRYYSCVPRAHVSEKETCTHVDINAYTHGVNDSFTARWRHIKHTGKYTDLVTKTPRTHSLNQRLMFCQGLSLYPPSAKNKWSEDVVEEITFEEFPSSARDEEREIKCSSKDRGCCVCPPFSSQRQARITQDVFAALMGSKVPVR